MRSYFRQVDSTQPKSVRAARRHRAATWECTNNHSLLIDFGMCFLRVGYFVSRHFCFLEHGRQLCDGGAQISRT